jgi:sarcosine oxidase
VVRRVDPADDGVTITSDVGTQRVRHAIVAAGPWTLDVAPWADLPLIVQRQTLGWYRATDPAAFEPSRFPIWIHETPDHTAYGFPSINGATVKMAIHQEGSATDPDSVDREIQASDHEPLDAFASQRLRGLDPHVAEMRVCMYTNTPDRHFIIGPVAGVPNITLLSPCSGHGFKFASVIGDIAADFALEGGTRRDIKLFDPNRFAKD